MITNIEIQNYKSIHKDHITLKDFTVLIGANASGKSNLIKAIDFLSAICNIGLAAAVTKYGGFYGMVPMVIPRKGVENTRIHFKYQTQIMAVKSFIEDLPPLTVEHEFKLGYSEKKIVRLLYEKIKYNQVLALAQYTRGYSRPSQLFEKYPESHFIVERGPRGGVSFSTSPAISEDNMAEYLEWLGLSDFKEKITSKTALVNFLTSIGHSKTDGSDIVQRDRIHRQSFLDPGVRVMIDYSRQARLFWLMMRNTRRYDLLLNELRVDQKVSDEPLLETAGTNMPAVWRQLAYTSDAKQIFERIASTMSAIAPHIKDWDTNSLRTGKEFVEFIESNIGRHVESWESSDGTLRALAILLALETHPVGSTIVIEEPEQNLHPWAIRSLLQHIRDVIKERSLQVIITTHSQQVLERVFPEEVLVATRTLEQGTKFKKLHEIITDGNIEMGEIGELWVRGLLGGVPSDE